MQAIRKEIGQGIGTAVGTGAATFGWADNEINILVAAVPIVVGLGFDLLVKGLFSRGRG